MQDPDALILLGGYKYTYDSEEEAPKKKLQTPVKVTTPLRGPLQLAMRSSLVINSINDRHCTCLPPPGARLPSIRLSRWDGLKHHGDAQKPRRLTRFPILDIRRPLEEIKDQLSGLTCADIQDSMTAWRVGNVMPTNSDSCTLPVKVPPLMSMNTQYGLPGTASKTTSNLLSFNDSGPMDISITVTRHALPDFVHWPNNKLHFQLPEVPSQPPTRHSNQKRTQTHMAPHSLVAFLAHQQQPITKSTVLSGRQVA